MGIGTPESHAGPDAGGSLVSSSDAVRDQLLRGIASAKAGETDLARRYLERALHLGPSSRQRADAHYWLARLCEDPIEKREHLSVVLQIEPSNYAARRDLAVLDGRLEEEDLVDPSEPQPSQAPSPQITGQRYLCAQCGGRLEFEASSGSITCSYCGYSKSVTRALEQGAAVAESDFIYALATAKGHTHPQHSPTFTCQACGATYLLQPGTLSLTCPHCGSVYAIKSLNAKNLVPPQGIISFQVTEDHAQARMRAWLDDQPTANIEGLSRVQGMYLPAWTFDISGEVPYTYRERQGDEGIMRRGSRLLMRDDLPVAATHRLPKALADEVYNFDFSMMRNYDPSLLAGWPAQTYEITATDAAMAARWHALEELRGRTERELSASVTDLRFKAAALVIGAYRLILLPFWVTGFLSDGDYYRAIVNGQTGSVRAERPTPRWWIRLRRLFGG